VSHQIHGQWVSQMDDVSSDVYTGCLQRDDVSRDVHTVRLKKMTCTLYVKKDDVSSDVHIG